MNDDKLKIVAKIMALHCCRNTSIEDIHSGFSPHTKTGDFTDVKVVTPYGIIPWNQVSRITQEEMCAFNKEVVNNIYTFLKNWLERNAIPGLLYPPTDWDDPVIDGDMQFAYDRVFNPEEAEKSMKEWEERKKQRELEEEPNEPLLDGYLWHLRYRLSKYHGMEPVKEIAAGDDHLDYLIGEKTVSIKVLDYSWKSDLEKMDFDLEISCNGVLRTSNFADLLSVIKLF
jgi:hypothetical protein